MTPQIALDLSLDGIAVLSRAEGGVWWREGVVRLDDPDMAGALTRLRNRCAARVGEDFTSILIIPDSQILFTSLERDDRDPKVTIRTLLRGRTPYEVEDLAFDYVQKGDRLQVAVVAIETLLEAEEFAAGFGYRPVALVADPGDSTYPGQAHFGQTGLAAEILAETRLDLDLEDGFDVVPAPAAPEMPEKPNTGDPAEDAPETASPDTPMDAEESPAEPVAETDGMEDEPPAPPIAPADTGTFEAALAAVDAAPAPAAAEPAPVPPTDEDPAMALPKTPATPTFTSRRKADGRAAVDTPEEPSLTRITPRLSAPTRETGPIVSKSLPPADAPAPAPLDATPQPNLPNFGFAGGKTRTTVGADAPPDSAAEAVALSLPGIAREEAAQPRRRGGAKLGLYLTLTLIGLMALVALWSVLQGAERDIAVAPASGDTAPQVPDAAPPGASEDIARLLPTSDATASTAPATSGPVAPPLPITDDDGPATAGSNAVENAPQTLELAGSFDDSPAPPAAPVPSTTETVIAAVDPARQDGETGPLPPAALPDAAPLSPAPATPASQETPAVPPVPNVVDPTDPETTAPEETTDPAPQVADAQDTPEGLDDSEEAAVLVVPQAQGTLAPGGYTVFAGRPAVLPLQRASDQEPPLAAPEAPAATAEDDAARAALRRTVPVQRPVEAEAEPEAEADAPPVADGVAREPLIRTRPRQRPQSITDAAARDAEAAREAEAARQAAAEDRAAAVDAAAAAAIASLASQTAAAAASPASPLALAASDRPRSRPRSVERDAARIVTQRREQARAAPAAAASTARQPEEPARAAPASPQTIRSAGGSVARAATQQNAIRLRDINLIGVYGRPNARRALVRLSNGRYVKVEVGDRLDRGRVTAIGDSQLVYQRGGRSVTLRMPNA